VRISLACSRNDESQRGRSINGNSYAEPFSVREARWGSVRNVCSSVGRRHSKRAAQGWAATAAAAALTARLGCGDTPEKEFGRKTWYREGRESAQEGERRTMHMHAGCSQPSPARQPLPLRLAGWLVLVRALPHATGCCRRPRAGRGWGLGVKNGNEQRGANAAHKATTSGGRWHKGPRLARNPACVLLRGGGRQLGATGKGGSQEQGRGGA